MKNRSCTICLVLCIIFSYLSQPQNAFSLAAPSFVASFARPAQVSPMATFSFSAQGNSYSGAQVQITKMPGDVWEVDVFYRGSKVELPVCVISNGDKKPAKLTDGKSFVTQQARSSLQKQHVQSIGLERRDGYLLASLQLGSLRGGNPPHRCEFRDVLGPGRHLRYQFSDDEVCTDDEYFQDELLDKRPMHFALGPFLKTLFQEGVWEHYAAQYEKLQLDREAARRRGRRRRRFAQANPPGPEAPEARESAPPRSSPASPSHKSGSGLSSSERDGRLSKSPQVRFEPREQTDPEAFLTSNALNWLRPLIELEVLTETELLDILKERPLIFHTTLNPTTESFESTLESFESRFVKGIAKYFLQRWRLNNSGIGQKRAILRAHILFCAFVHSLEGPELFRGHRVLTLDQHILFGIKPSTNGALGPFFDLWLTYVLPRIQPGWVPSLQDYQRQVRIQREHELKARQQAAQCSRASGGGSTPRNAPGPVALLPDADGFRGDLVAPAGEDTSSESYYYSLGILEKPSPTGPQTQNWKYGTVPCTLKQNAAGSWQFSLGNTDSYQLRSRLEAFLTQVWPRCQQSLSKLGLLDLQQLSFSVVSQRQASLARLPASGKKIEMHPALLDDKFSLLWSFEFMRELVHMLLVTSLPNQQQSSLQQLEKMELASTILAAQVLHGQQYQLQAQLNAFAQQCPFRTFQLAASVQCDYSDFLKAVWAVAPQLLQVQEFLQLIGDPLEQVTPQEDLWRKLRIVNQKEQPSGADLAMGLRAYTRLALQA